MAKTLLDRKIEEIPKDWNSLKLGEFSKFSQGIQVGVEKHKTTFEEGYVRFIRIIDYTQNTDDIRYIKHPGDKYCVNEDDIVMVRYGTPGVVGRGIKGAVANNMFKIIPDNNLITNDYLCYSLIQGYIHKILSEGSGSSTMPAINFSMLSKIPIAIPPLTEQPKIVEILYTVDADIEKTDAIIKETQQLKKGLMEKLFIEGIGHTRFKKTKIGGIPETWEIKKLGEYIDVLTDYHANGSYKKLKENVELLRNEDYAIMIRTTNLVDNNFSDLRYISKSAYNFLAKSKVSPGDIVMNKIADPGTVFLVPQLGKPLSLGMNLFLIRTNPKLTNQTFVFYYLKQNENYIKRFTSGSTTKTITKEAVRNLTILVPPLDEQKKIVRLLSEIDSKLDNEKAYKSELEQLKKGLSQVLLTGQVRVKV